jgi:hypothetical protein
VFLVHEDDSAINFRCIGLGNFANCKNRVGNVANGAAARDQDFSRTGWYCCGTKPLLGECPRDEKSATTAATTINANRMDTGGCNEIQHGSDYHHTCRQPAAAG